MGRARRNHRDAIRKQRAKRRRRDDNHPGRDDGSDDDRIDIESSRGGRNSGRSRRSVGSLVGNNCDVNVDDAVPRGDIVLGRASAEEGGTDQVTGSLTAGIITSRDHDAGGTSRPTTTTPPPPSPAGGIATSAASSIAGGADASSIVNGERIERMRTRRREQKARRREKRSAREAAAGTQTAVVARHGR